MLRYLVCDLDGTLCDCAHRQHLAQAGQWDEFHSLLGQDQPRRNVLRLLDMIIAANKDAIRACTLIFLTGRPERVREQTYAWLRDKAGLYVHDDYENLLMRPNDDYRSDAILKLEMLQQYAAHREWPKEEVLILDDRDKVVAAFRDAGYEVWQVNEGAF